MDVTETLGEKAGCGLHKNVSSCLEQILEGAPYKIAAVWLLTSHHTNHPSKMSKTCLLVGGKVITSILQWTPLHKPTNTGRQAMTNIHTVSG